MTLIPKMLIAGLVLTGVVVGALLGAGVGLVKYLADPYNQLPAMTFWLLGSLAATTASDLLPLAAPVVLGTAVALCVPIAGARVCGSRRCRPS